MAGDVRPEIIECENAGILASDGTVTIENKTYYKYIPSNYNYLSECEFYRYDGESTIIDPGHENVLYVTLESPADLSGFSMYIIDRHSGEIYATCSWSSNYGDSYDDNEQIFYNVGFDYKDHSLDMNW